MSFGEGSQGTDSHDPGQLREEFRYLIRSFINLTETRFFSDPTCLAYSSSFSTGGDTIDEYYSDEYYSRVKDCIYSLWSIADRMNCLGCLDECVQIYVTARKSFLDSSFQKLGIQKLSTVDIQRMGWAAAELKIKAWVRAAPFCIHSLFLREKKLCEEIFEGLESSAIDKYFVEAVQDHAVLLFNFVKVVSSSSRSSEKLFRILDLYKTTLDLLHQNDTTLSSKLSDLIRSQAAKIQPQIGSAARETVLKFEDEVLGDRSKIFSVEDGVHSFTKYVMNHVLRMIKEYEQELTVLLLSQPSPGTANMAEELPYMETMSNSERRFPSLVAHLIHIITILRQNLRCKAKECHDASFAHVFLANNDYHIVQEIESCQQLREKIGEDYLGKMKVDIEQEINSYIDSTWSKILEHLNRRVFWLWCTRGQRGLSGLSVLCLDKYIVPNRHGGFQIHSSGQSFTCLY